MRFYSHLWGKYTNVIFCIWNIANPACKVVSILSAKDYNYQLTCFYNKFLWSCGFPFPSKWCISHFEMQLFKPVWGGRGEISVFTYCRCVRNMTALRRNTTRYINSSPGHIMLINLFHPCLARRVRPISVILRFSLPWILCIRQKS